MKLIVAIAALVVVSSLQAEEKDIRDKSPDGKFALRLTHGEEGWETAIVDAKTKKKVIDLESVAVNGDKDRNDWMVRGGYQSLEDYGKEATLLWSNDSQRVAYFNESRDEHTTTVYFRNGDTFEGVALPEFPRCDEIKGEDPKYLTTVYYTVTPKYWPESSALFLEVHGDWRTIKGDSIDCDQSITIAFDAQHKASIQKIEEPQESLGRRIESPNGTFFLEELDVATKDDDGRPDVDHEVWIVSAKDPATRERLPDFYERSGSAILADAAISPDENWMLVAQNRGSHMNATYLFRRTGELKFEDVFQNAKWPPMEDSSDRFDNEAWKFFSKAEGVPLAKIDIPDLGPTQISFLDWSADSGRLLVDLHGGLTGSVGTPDRDRYKKPGVSVWVAYFNTKTRKFELTDRLRKNNKGARQRWKAMANENEEAPENGLVPPSAEPIGHEGPDAPLAERLKKYEADLTALVERRRSQLKSDDRAEFEKSEADWRDKLENEVAKIKNAQIKLGLRTRSTWYHLSNVRQCWLPVYEEPKSAAEK